MNPTERTEHIHNIAYSIKEINWKVDSGIPFAVAEELVMDRENSFNELAAEVWQDGKVVSVLTYDQRVARLKELLQDRADDYTDDSRNYQAVNGIDY